MGNNSLHGRFLFQGTRQKLVLYLFFKCMLGSKNFNIFSGG